jgi:hypothetical protein
LNWRFANSVKLKSAIFRLLITGLGFSSFLMTASMWNAIASFSSIVQQLHRCRPGDDPRHDAIRRTNHADVDQGDMLAGHSTERTHQQLRRAAARTASEDVSSEDPDFPQWFFHSRPD